MAHGRVAEKEHSDPGSHHVDARRGVSQPTRFRLYFGCTNGVVLGECWAGMVFTVAKDWLFRSGEWIPGSSRRLNAPHPDPGH